MTCTYRNPSPDAVTKAKQERAQVFRDATCEDDLHSAAESNWQDYLPLCFCPECMQ